MAFDNNIFDTDIITAVSNVGNDTTTNTASATLGLDNVGNDTTTVSDVFNTDVTVEDSFKNNSGNAEWDVEDSGNTGSYNDWVTITDDSATDNSINAGVREYNTGFGDLHLGGGAGGGGGTVWINNQNTVVDQSSSGNILSGDGVFQFAANEAQVASGDGAFAAGDDNTIIQSLDTSTNIAAGGDVLINSDKTVDVAIGSNNTTTVTVEDIDNSIEVDLDNVGNNYSATLSIEESFNDVTVDVSTEEWDIDADVIWDSTLAVVADDIDVAL